MAQINTNTTDLENILATITALPDYIDTSDANATDKQIIAGKTAYVNGIKVTGTMESAMAPVYTDGTPVKSGEYLAVNYTPEDSSSGTYHAYQANITIKTPLTTLGDAKADQVLSGTTFTSTAGLKVTGTIATKTSGDISVNGATITVPSGYYSNEMSKSVATVTQATPTISIDSSGLITASVTQSAGYVSAGTKKATKTIPTETKTITANGTYTPSSGKYFSSVTVNTPVGYKSGDVVNATSISLSLGTSYMPGVSVTYGTSVVNTNGVLSLGDSTSVTASSAGELNVIKGKYIKISSTIYYIPTDANITYTGNNYNKSYTTDKASPVFVIA